MESARRRTALAPVTVKHHAAIKDPQQIGELLRAIDDYPSGAVVDAAIKDKKTAEAVKAVTNPGGLCAGEDFLNIPSRR